jgi:hypothetical protein
MGFAPLLQAYVGPGVRRKALVLEIPRLATEVNALSVMSLNAAFWRCTTPLLAD